MKILNVLMSVALLSTVAHAECEIVRTDAGSKTTESMKIQSEIWSQYDQKNPNRVKLASGNVVSFTIETFMMNPDTGIEIITILGAQEDQCEFENIFMPNEKGQSIFSGVKTTCIMEPGLTTSVSCSL